MKIYTKRGDAGVTGLIGGEKLNKDEPIFGALGNLDELNAAIGVCLVHAKDADGEVVLKRLQEALFAVGAELASPDDRWAANGLAELTKDMEESIDYHDRTLPELKNFILPGGTLLAASLHSARAVCRRAERAVVSLKGEKAIRDEVLAFINRTSDWLFSAARVANHEARVEDTTWGGMRQE